MKFSFIFLIHFLSPLSLTQAADNGNSCIAANEYIEFAGKANRGGAGTKIETGDYMRVSPDGRFVMQSRSGSDFSQLSLMEIRDVPGDNHGKRVAVAYDTPLTLEGFPTQGTWRTLTDTDGCHYQLRDIVRNERNAKCRFKGGMNGFYAASGELRPSADSKARIRSMSWPNGRSNGSDQGVGELRITEIDLRTSASGDLELEKDHGKIGIFSGNGRQICKNLKDTEGTTFSVPMISVDGTEIAAQPMDPKDKRQTIRIYRILDDGVNCEKKKDTGVASMKAIFGFAQPGKEAPLVLSTASMMKGTPSSYNVWQKVVIDAEGKPMTVALTTPEVVTTFPRETVSGIHMLDRATGELIYVGDRSRGAAPGSYPGMTKDGRIVYTAKWQVCWMIPKVITSVDPDTKIEIKNTINEQKCEMRSGLVMTDPYQSEGMKHFKEHHPDLASSTKKCITKAEVVSTEIDQDSIYQFQSEQSKSPQALPPGKR